MKAHFADYELHFMIFLAMIVMIATSTMTSPQQKFRATRCIRLGFAGQPAPFISHAHAAFSTDEALPPKWPLKRLGLMGQRCRALLASRPASRAPSGRGRAAQLLTPPSPSIRPLFQKFLLFLRREDFDDDGICSCQPERLHMPLAAADAILGQSRRMRESRRLASPPRVTGLL